MTTSITDARFTHLHASEAYIIALLKDKTLDEDPDACSVMPGFEMQVTIAPHLDPPRLDHDDTLPSQIHPSYPYGRPRVGKSRAGGGPGASAWGRAGANSGTGGGAGGAAQRRAQPTSLLEPSARADDVWTDLNLGALIEDAGGREVPPVMAGAKRPPSPPSPQLHPFPTAFIRSTHLQRHLDRQAEVPQSAAADQFDAPVPNETYADGDDHTQQHAAQTPDA